MAMWSGTRPAEEELPGWGGRPLWKIGSMPSPLAPSGGDSVVSQGDEDFDEFDEDDFDDDFDDDFEEDLDEEFGEDLDEDADGEDMDEEEGGAVNKKDQALDGGRPQQEPGEAPARPLGQEVAHGVADQDEGHLQEHPGLILHPSGEKGRERREDAIGPDKDHVGRPDGDPEERTRCHSVHSVIILTVISRG
jgi:hypothetical protein